MMPEFLLYYPTVYCVRNKYQIIFITKEVGAGAVIINGVRYTDDVCGVVRTTSRVHKIYVDTSVLDGAGGYTVEFKRIAERLTYHTQTVSTETAQFSFRPIPKDKGINCYIISDTHGSVEEPTETAKYFGDKLDLFILGGDIGKNAKTEEGLLTIAELSSNIAKGEIPVIFMRGNHDARGAFSEFLPDYIGTDRGLTYFPIRLGRLWFVLLDSGEDKPDEHESYGDLANFSAIRNDESLMLDTIIENSASEYSAEGVEVRFALCHVPFILYNSPCYDVFVRWTELLNKMNIHVMLSGHKHRVHITQPENAPIEGISPNFPCVECAAINREDLSTYKGTALTIEKDKLIFRFTDLMHNVAEEHIISIS